MTLLYALATVLYIIIRNRSQRNQSETARRKKRTVITKVHEYRKLLACTLRYLFITTDDILLIVLLIKEIGHYQWKK
jgi:hypothetical protein